MPKKYHIPIHEAPPRFVPVGKSTVLDWEGGCLRCFKCVKRLCIYDAYNKRSFDVTRLADTIDSVCKNCLRCVQMCPGRVISKKPNPEYDALGNKYWTPEIISKQWEQATTGKLPVSGAGYRGPFTGPGFDGMWTDMSEIVRPTRDGIHGREYINTSVSLGRKASYLKFDEKGAPLLDAPENIEIPVPMIFGQLPFGALSDGVFETLAQAASEMGTLACVPVKDWAPVLDPYASSLVPLFTPDQMDDGDAIISKAPMAAMDQPGEGVEAVEAFQNKYPGKLLMVQVPADEKAVEQAETLTRQGVDVICLTADYNGQGLGKKKKIHIRDLIREVHLNLVEKGIRDTVTLLAGGGIALAEHVAKAVICGADAVVLDVPLLLSLECTMCLRCEKGLECPVAMKTVAPEWGKKRIMNFMAAWRNQILELLGAMGIREAKRLRGETGRAMFFEDMEKQTFGRLFGKKKTTQAAQG